MKSISVIGIGRVGYNAVKYLVEDYNYEVLAIECIDKSKLLSGIGNTMFRRACSPREALKYIEEEEPSLVGVALTSVVAKEYIEELLGNGYSIVDASYIDFDPYTYEELCRDNNVFYVVDAGFAPGFSNLVVGYVYDRVGELDRVAIYVGGNPVEPKPPLYYEITWSARDLLEEYTRKARIVRNYQVLDVDPLEHVGRVEIPGKGVYEYFYSDGLHTLVRNIRAREMFEATIRYPGHLEVIKLLRNLGFFDREPINIDGYSVKPIDFTAGLLEERFSQKSIDEAVLYIVIEKNNKYYRLLSILRGIPGLSSIAKYTALVFAKTINIALEKGVRPGVIPLEHMHMYYRDYLEYLEKHGVVFSIETNTE
ncbi:MAG: saccharopine dehydrogenase C-terminal domain-containing protein [Thermoprotei archaeon]